MRRGRLLPCHAEFSRGRHARAVVLPLILAVTFAAGFAQVRAADDPDVTRFLGLASPDEATFDQTARELAPLWRDGYTAMLVDLARLMRGISVRGAAGDFDPDGFADEGDEEQPGLDSGGAAAGRYDPGSPVRRRLIRFLEDRTGQKFGDDLDAWRRWMWSRPYDPHPDYALWKGGVYGNIDPRMRQFFPAGVAADVRLDQVDWGGVRVDGIPPLVEPAVETVAEATWLKDKNVVFGVMAGGKARAYPQRILAWHELARDTLGGVPLTIVYCTLCGTVIPYESRVGDTTYTFGTSGFLYKSNKLMYDRETESLWSSVYGRPVVGPLVGKGIRLVSLPVVTTTWGEWKALHPETTVISIETGFDRDYAEGVAYKDYFRTDAPMFLVTEADSRLPNKAEVLVLPFTETSDISPVAIAVDFLKRRTVYSIARAGKSVVVLTSPKGANRVYETGGRDFVRLEGDDAVVDSAGVTWKLTEPALVPNDAGIAPLPRVAAHRVFWFGWYAQHPDTELIR